MGAPGSDGMDGQNGAPGTDGQDGAPGIDGQDGISCWDLNANSQCDAATEDTDMSGVCDAADCEGEQGPQGQQGQQGQQGAQGPAGPTLFKQSTFLFVNVPAAGQPDATVGSITFTPPASGTAVVRARGYCNIDGISGQNVEINLGLGTASAAPFLDQVTSWGVLRVPNGAPAVLHQLMFSAERTFAVNGGTATTVTLAGRHTTGTAADDCSGSIVVEIFTGTLP